MLSITCIMFIWWYIYSIWQCSFYLWIASPLPTTCTASVSLVLRTYIEIRFCNSSILYIDYPCSLQKNHVRLMIANNHKTINFHVYDIILKSTYSDLIKPMIIETSHNFQLSLTVVVNFPRNIIIMTWMIKKRTRYKSMEIMPFFYRALQQSPENKAGSCKFTWRTRVIPTIPMNKRFLVTPLNTFISSGLRALNSLNICSDMIFC